MASGKICTSSALWLPSARGIAVTPTNEPCLMSESDALTTPAICGLSASATFSSAPSRAFTCRSRKSYPARIRAMRQNQRIIGAMLAILHLLGTFIANLFKSQRRLEVENLFLRHQLNIALRGAPHRLQLRASDRALLVWMTWLWPGLLSLSHVVQPDTILRWHRAGFRAYWRRKSRGRPGRPRVSRELRELIQRMSKENPLWGAPRIHGELLKLGSEIAESTVSKYMIRRRGPPSQTWRTFLRNHAAAIAAIDLCVVPTLTFECLFAFLVLGHDRRHLLWFAVTDTRPRSGWRSNSWRHSRGARHRAIWCATTTASMDRHSRIASGRWGFATARSHRGRPDRTLC